MIFRHELKAFRLLVVQDPFEEVTNVVIRQNLDDVGGGNGFGEHDRYWENDGEGMNNVDGRDDGGSSNGG